MSTTSYWAVPTATSGLAASSIGVPTYSSLSDFYFTGNLSDLGLNPTKQTDNVGLDNLSDSYFRNVLGLNPTKQPDWAKRINLKEENSNVGEDPNGSLGIWDGVKGGFNWLGSDKGLNTMKGIGIAGQLGLGIASYFGDKALRKKQLEDLSQDIETKKYALEARKNHVTAMQNAFGKGY